MARIVVVEDNPQNLKLATLILQTAGHQVVPARDAEEFAHALQQGRPDLILMDLALPGKDGYTLTRELRERPETSDLPVLAVSSFAMRGDAERALAAGCNAYLTKPIRRADLLEHVDALLGVAPPAAGGSSAGPVRDAPGPTEPDASPPPATRGAASVSATEIAPSTSESSSEPSP
jgi:two-component system cell cycle response regulator DivK